MRVLVTGGAGFVGSHLCERLLADGHQVTALDNFITGSRDNVAGFADQGDFTLLEADLCSGVPGDEKYDRIYHLASPASPIDYVDLPFETLYVGSDGTRSALERGEKDGARLLLASTSEVYGDPDVHPQVETYWGNVNPIGPRSVYDEAKRYAEALTMAFHRYRGADIRIVRIFNTYGPRMRANDGRVVPAFITQALAGTPLTVFGDGLQTRSFCYVEDLVEGLVRMMDGDWIGPCNLGNPVERTILDLAENITRILGCEGELVYRNLPQDDPSRRRPDITQATERLGWTPKVSFDDGLRRTIDWFRD